MKINYFQLYKRESVDSGWIFTGFETWDTTQDSKDALLAHCKKIWTGPDVKWMFLEQQKEIGVRSLEDVDFLTAINHPER